MLAVAWLLTALFGIAALLAGATPRAAPPADRHYRRADRPNVLMIGCDTLRADRVVPGHYHRDLAPNIRALAQRGTLFANCYVPVARTAPSLVSLLTGAWPKRHGIRDNFVAAEDLSPHVQALPTLLKAHGYRTVAISDWAGSDLGKFDLGFDEVDAPEDQWNIKYLIRQGPKDLRLFLSLFTHNELGRRLLPEIYYLPGRPLVSDLGTRTMQEITRCVDTGQPFLVNVFMAAGHPPFSVEYPYYMKYASPDYRGESKFVMSKLTDPMEIIRSQQSPREAFDLDQIIDLYDSCVHRFDVEVGRIVRHLQDSGLIDSTIVVIYGDHGMEFFEHGTWGQGNSALGDFSARIPLVVRAPTEAPRGVVTDVVRSIDLVPTLLRQLGMSIPESVDGCDLFSDLPVPTEDRTAYFETGIWLAKPPNAEPGHLSYPDILKLLNIEDPARGTLVIKDDFAVRVLQARDRLVRSGQWVMLYQPFESRAEMRLYNLTEDPAFAHDIAAARPDIVSQLYEKLQPFLLADV